MAAAAALARMELKPKAKPPSSQGAIKNQGRRFLEDAAGVRAWLGCKALPVMAPSSEIAPAAAVGLSLGREFPAWQLCSWSQILADDKPLRNGAKAHPEPEAEHPQKCLLPWSRTALCKAL